MIPSKLYTLFRRLIVAAPTFPSLRGSPTTGTFISNTTITSPTNSNGDVLVCFFFHNTGGSADAGNANGWTRQFAVSINSVYLICSTKVSAGSDTTTPIAATQTGAYTTYAVQGGSTVDAVGSGDFANSTTPTASAISTTNAADILLTAYNHAQVQSVTITVASGQVASGQIGLSGQDGSGALNCGSETLTQTGSTGTRAGTISNTGVWRAGSIAIR